jgi:hypothetical protein
MISQTTTATTTPASFQQEFQHRAAWKAGVMGAFNVLAVVLAVRLILLVAVGGAIGLAWLALQQPDPYRLGALAIYCAVVVLPTIYLAGSRS